MKAYVPSGLSVALAVAGTLGAALLLALATTRLRRLLLARASAWGLTVGVVASIDRLAAFEPPGFRMLALIVGLLFGMKAVVSVESAADAGFRLPPTTWLAFATLWPGMRPALFARRHRSLPGAKEMLLGGLTYGALGVLLLPLARWAFVVTGSPWLATAPLLVGLSLLLHFGVFKLAAGLWRMAGVDCRPLFRAPLLSRSLGEFWSRRWNLAFSEMTSAAAYRPVRRRLGRPAGLLAAFLLSGLLHEIAISVPVGAGFGGPTAYFAFHGVLTALEDRMARRGRPVDRAAGIGRLWTVTTVVLPLPLLFHRPFLVGVVWPLIGA